MLSFGFFDRDPCRVAIELLGKVICHYDRGLWLSAQIIETEAYYLKDKASHASLGMTPKRRALFMEAGTIYMYYARGGDSLNFSCHGAGNAVLIKGAYPYLDGLDDQSSLQMIARMQANNPNKHSQKARKLEKLCSGQTLLCRALGLKVADWDQKACNQERFFLAARGYQPKKIIQTKRLGISPGRDEHLFYRFIDYDYAAYCSQNVLRQKRAQEPHDYVIWEANLKNPDQAQSYGHLFAHSRSLDHTACAP